MDNNDLFVQFDGLSSTWWDSGVTVTTGIWTYVAVTYDGSNIRVFRNGVNSNSQGATGTLNLGSNSNPLYIGHNTEWTNEVFTGKIDEVRISNLARSQSWISAQYLSMNNEFITYGSEESQDQGAGAAYIFFGYSTMDTNNINASSANVTITGETAGSLLGWSVNEAGDVNGDNIPDVIIGAPGNNSDSGSAHLFFGRTTWNNVYDSSDANTTLNGENAGDMFGYSVSFAGDVNNTGFDAVIIGAPKHSSSQGRAYIFYGSGSMSPSVSANYADDILNGETSGDLFGFSVSNAGNVNDDDCDDVLIGAPGADKAYVYYGYFLDELNYVDSNTDNIGSTSNFANAQSASDAGAYSTLTEGTNTISYNPTSRTLLGSTSDGGGVISNLASNDGSRMVFDAYTTGSQDHDYQFVDNNISDVDNVADNGTHSNFNNEKSIDSNYDTLTENYTSGYVPDFKVQRGYTIINNGDTSATITAGLDYSTPTGDAFIRIVGTRQTAIGRPSGGGTQNADDVTVYISNPNNLGSSITFERYGTSNDNRLSWEIIEYIGPNGGNNEFKVRAVGETNFSSTDTSNTTPTISGIVDDSDVVVFITGVGNPDTGASDYNTHLCTSSWLSVTNQANFTRGEAGGDTVNVSYAVVEFTGSNWSVQLIEHNYASSGVQEEETITDIGSVSSAFTIFQHRAGSDELGLDENGAQCYLYNSTTLRFQLQSGVTTPNLHYTVSWVVNNSGTGGASMNVQHITGTRGTGGAEEDTWTESIISVNSTETSSIMGESGRSSGSGNSFPRGYISFYLSDDSLVELKQSDTGQIQNYAFCVVDWPKSIGQYYDLDLEVQFTSANTSNELNEICIKTGTLGTEDLQVEYWSGSTWVNIFSDLSPNTWNNASVPISSSTFTVHFFGPNETKDTNQDSWEIDALQLHSWNNTYDMEVELSGASDTYSWSQLGWVLDLQFSVATMNVTIQLYNYTNTEYPGAGDGFIQYDSGAANNDELKSQIISSDMGNFKDGSGNWRVKILASYIGANFSCRVDWVEMRHPSYQMDIEFSTNSVAISGHYYLEINYQVNGENYDIMVYNGATWDDMGDLTSGSMTELQISLNSNHRLGSGQVRIRYIGTNEIGDNSPSTLYIEYHRIHCYQPGMNYTADVTLMGSANSGFGWSVSYAGDINNDNFDDVIVGAPGYVSSKGAAYIYKGSNNMDNIVNVTLIGYQSGDQFGYSVAYAGDIDNDGFSDVLIGAPGNDGPLGTRSDTGAIYLFHGSLTFSGTYGAECANGIGYGENAGDHFGWSVDRCGNINKDVYKNLIVGAPNFGEDDGKAYIMKEIPEFSLFIIPIIFVMLLLITNNVKNKKRRYEKRL